MNTPTTAPTTPPAPTFEFDFHPLADIFPLLQSDDLRDLATDIRERGLIEPITIHEGKILDGRNRYRAAKLVRFNFTERCFRSLPDGMNPEAFVIGANIHRRHLTAEQKRDLIVKLIKADPAKSDRQIAETAKVDNKTVGKVREKLEATEEIPQLTETTGKDGKKRKKNAKAKEKKTKAKEKDEEPKRDMTKYRAFLDAVLDALANWPRDYEQASEWNDYTREKLSAVMDEWLEKYSQEGEDEEAEAA